LAKAKALSSEKLDAKQIQDLPRDHDHNGKRDHRERSPTENIIEARVLQVTVIFDRFKQDGFVSSRSQTKSSRGFGREVLDDYTK